MPSHDWKLSSYDYKLPQSLIAQHPAPKRDQSRMLFLERKSGKISNRNFTEIVSLLPESSCLVINNTKVLPARIPGKRQSGGKIEALLIEENNNGDWSAIVRKAGRIKQGERLEFCDGKLLAKAKERLEEGEWLLEFEETERLKERLEDVGLPPLPPYIERRNASDLQNTKDRERYQTCFATEPGAIAAPTAGLHFTPEILTEIGNRGIDILEVTLHVGLGTFSSIDQEDIRKHKMHAEFFSVSSQTLRQLQVYQNNNKQMINVGTTSVRVLETLVRQNFQESSGWTDIFIYPPCKFTMTDGLLTNFHLPKSTLMLLVSAFCGREFLLSSYQHAVAEKYRFFSYGDCMLIL
ncbi:MAG TPA: tRNA preQ1(34) S-adenosylmethionine ribosyltransferase-isomerase QueA [Candidatus Lambdaproteobacteria bacterium]|jgi:S-adenosylmethionine:tRNA ribosyltransferase-isomerase|nr:tRNA preQ1(34) S-adenosylmethionine ribosyltransferase-isomerase QueA [Candidatus Lambdaproteobacteria bacterium]